MGDVAAPTDPTQLLALLAPVGSAVALPWLLLGVHLELDAVGRLFLLFSSLVWLATGVYVASGRAEGAAEWAVRLARREEDLQREIEAVEASDHLLRLIGRELQGFAIERDGLC